MPKRNAVDLEKDIFEMSHTQEEYLNYAASLLVRLKTQICQEKRLRLRKYIKPLTIKIKALDPKSDEIPKLQKCLDVLLSSDRPRLCDIDECEASLCEYGLTKNLDDILKEFFDTMQKGPDTSSLQPTVNEFVDLDPFPRKRKFDAVETGPTMSPVLEREILNLDHKFCVKSTIMNNIELTCFLNDPDLPIVPPIYIAIPADYPDTLPIYMLPPSEYGTNGFLYMVRKAILKRFKHLPVDHTVTQMLESWQNAVKQVCAETYCAKS